MSSLKPSGDRVLVLSVASGEKSVGGILLPENLRAATNDCTVIAVGSKNTDVVIGNTVLIACGKGIEIALDGAKYLLVEADDIIGIRE